MNGKRNRIRHVAGRGKAVYNFMVEVIAPTDIKGNPVIVDWLPMKKINYTDANSIISPVYDINLDIHMGDDSEFNLFDDKGPTGEPIIVYLTFTKQDQATHSDSAVKVYILDDNTRGQWVELPKEKRAEDLNKMEREIGAIFEGVETGKNGKKYLKLSIYRWPKNDRQIGHNG